jgi:hypothetical protein
MRQEVRPGHKVRGKIEVEAGDPGTDRHRDQRRVQRVPVSAREGRDRPFRLFHGLHTRPPRIHFHQPPLSLFLILHASIANFNSTR